MAEPDIQFLFKIILVGDSGVGKTNLLTRFVKNEFQTQSKPTIGVDFFSKTLQIEKKWIKAQIWDTAGQERYKAFSSAYFSGSHGAIIAYDVTNLESFNNVKQWVEELKNHLDFSKIVVMLIGNKSDLGDKRAVSEDQGRALAEDLDFFFMETSAMKNPGNVVNKAFQVIIEEILVRNPEKKKAGGEGGEKMGKKVDTNDKPKKGCC